MIKGRPRLLGDGLMLILLAVKTEKTSMVIGVDGADILKGAGMVTIWLNVDWDCLAGSCLVGEDFERFG
jgi:hypothetical protein